MRAVAFAAFVSLLALAPAGGATADETAGPTWRHGTSLIGEPKYPPGWQHYDYVNVDAPKGGTLNLSVVGAFDSLNPFIVQGAPAAGILRVYDTLMDDATDQASTNYALLAEAMSYPDDFSWAKFRLNPAARFNDGQPVTAEDVVWSFDTLKSQSPFYNRYYESVAKAEITGDREVTFTFDKAGNRELPNIVGQLPVLPKHWWLDKDASGKPRDVSKTTLEPPLGSGPYRIESVDPGRQVVYSRVKDYWGANQPTQVGRNNFDRVQYNYYRDPTAEWEAFKKGGLSDYRIENRIGRWTTEYTFPAVKSGDVVLKSFPYHAAGRMQGFLPNLRRDKFKDPRVRQALNYVFDFETMNRQLFFDKYKRIESYFAGIDLASSGLPEGRELEILETVKDKVPPEVFTTPYKLPVNDTPQALRDNFRKAIALFAEAGWVLKGNQLVNAKTGEPFTIEFLEDDPSFERVVSPFIQNLKRVGISATLRNVDTAQYEQRLNNFDFDMISMVIAQSQSPGNEQRAYWGSAAADQPGSRNYMGIKDPAVDALIDKVVYATNRDDLVAATHALDRVLLWNYYAVPQWYSDELHLASWKKLGIPDKQPDYSGIDPDSFWDASVKAAGAAP